MLVMQERDAFNMFTWMDWFERACSLSESFYAHRKAARFQQEDRLQQEDEDASESLISVQ